MLREARQSAGLSQRAVAAASGVSARTVSAAESGEHQPSSRVLTALLAACGLELTTIPSMPAAEPCRHLREHLRLPTTERFARAPVADGRREELLADLSALWGPDALVLEPAGSVPVWVPGAHVPVPLVVTAHRLPFTPRLHQLPPTTAIVLRTTTDPLPAGLVAMKVARGITVHVQHPAALARDPYVRRWRPALSAAARLLHEESGTDDAGRRAPAHRQPGEDEESRRLGTTLRYIGVVRPRLPSALDSRGFRTAAPVSLPQWLEENGLAPLRGQRERWW
jgi:transcriptional regulator with XRE-family HTH domain